VAGGPLGCELSPVLLPRLFHHGRQQLKLTPNASLPDDGSADVFVQTFSGLKRAAAPRQSRQVAGWNEGKGSAITGKKITFALDHRNVSFGSDSVIRRCLLNVRFGSLFGLKASVLNRFTARPNFFS
jgi:hypothetical protein